MKVLNKDFVPNGTGTITFSAEGSDDLWIAYNLISPGDHVSADTARKVQDGSGGAKSGSRSTRVKMKVSIKVISTEYDREGSVLRARGKSVSSNGGGAGLAAGAFHTLEIKPNLPFEVTKKVWNSSALDLLEQSSNSGGGDGADLAVVLMRETVATINLVGKTGSKTCAKIENSDPRKKKTDSSTFFESVFRAFNEHVDFRNTRFVVIASPGSIKDQFLKYLMAESQRLQLKSITDNKSRIVLFSTNSGTKQTLKEVVEAEVVKKMISDSIDAEETEIYKSFTDVLSSDSSRACYGLKSVEMAVELLAVETLLITDELYKSSNAATRRKYENLVDAVKKSGGTAHLFCSGSANGEELKTMTGVAAILRFPVPDLDELEL